PRCLTSSSPLPQSYLPPTKNGVEPKRPSRPINITSLVRLSTTVPNTIVVSWTSEIGRSFSMAVYLARQQTSTTLLQRLRAKGIRNPDHSRALSRWLSDIRLCYQAWSQIQTQDPNDHRR
uniref:PINIT domain-containing protein n=1 Tax=Hucho hucho TaxID=62062 RepID=A0A4W5KJ49_9TELE